MHISKDRTGTLRAEDHGHPPLVAYGFEPGVAQRLNPESRFTEEVSPALRANAGDNQTSVVLIENHPHDSRVEIRDDGICQSLTGRMGTGGNNVPLVLLGYEDKSVCREEVF